MTLSAPSKWEESRLFMMEYDFHPCHKQFAVAYEMGLEAAGAASHGTGQSARTLWGLLFS